MEKIIPAPKTCVHSSSLLIFPLVLRTQKCLK